MQRNIKVLVVEPNREPVEEIIHNRLSDKQNIVGGLIEYVSLDDDPNILLVCNEKRDKLNLPDNRIIDDEIITGTFLIVGDNDTGEDRSLTDDQINLYKKYFGKESFVSKEINDNNIDL